MNLIEDTMDWKKNNKSVINNPKLRGYVAFQLGKEDFTKADLESIHEIILDSEDIVGNYNPVYFSEVELFPNLKTIIINHLTVTSKNMEKLRNIPEIQFENCELDGIENLHHVEMLSITNSSIDNLEEMEQLTNLTELSLINLPFEKYEMIKKYPNLKKLTIKNIPDFSMSKIDYPLPIEYLSLGTIPDFKQNVIEQMKNLKCVSIARKEIDKLRSELEWLKNKGIKVLIDDIYEY